MNPPGTINHRVNVSMVPLKWSDVLSTLLPGAVALYAIAPVFPSLRDRLRNLDGAGTATGLMLLIAAALAGGVLEAITRIAWEPLWLVRRCAPPDALANLESANLDLYERGVQSSYKYVTFYANFAWATVLLLISRLVYSQGWCCPATFILILTICILLRASHVQWTYYVNYQKKIFARRKILC
jgi:hypothetical protein